MLGRERPATHATHYYSERAFTTQYFQLVAAAADSEFEAGIVIHATIRPARENLRASGLCRVSKRAGKLWLTTGKIWCGFSFEFSSVLWLLLLCLAAGREPLELVHVVPAMKKRCCCHRQCCSRFVVSLPLPSVFKSIAQPGLRIYMPGSHIYILVYIRMYACVCR